MMSPESMLHELAWRLACVQGPAGRTLWSRVSACLPAGGAAQAFILHAFGGVDLDPDVECLHPMDQGLEQHALILQSEPRPGTC